MRTDYFHPAIAILAFCLAGCASAPTRDTGSVRVLVYNIRAGKDAAGVDNLARVAEIIRSSRAGVVLLQEVDNRTRRSGGVDQLSRLRELTGMQGVFGKAIEYDGGEYGTAILSRWPITSSRLVILPAGMDDSAVLARYEARGALIARLDHPSGAIRVVNTHLDASRNDSIRIQQANALVILANAQQDSGLTILGGDFNAEPDSRVIDLLRQNGWRDVFARCGKDSGLSFPADKPVKRIDYLFARSGIACAAASVPDTQASDHRPVLFDMVPRRRD